MALGDQSKALRIMSQMKGWDPTLIPASGDKPAVDMGNFDKAPNPATNVNGLGTLPDGYPDMPKAGDPGGVPFNVPQGHGQSMETNRRTVGADPFAGFSKG